MSAHDSLAEGFETHRSRLRAVAQRMLGSHSEAEDAVSAAAERWFWITFSAGATEGHHNRDHERPWLMYSSRTC
ncbi:sigma factor, partial [Streptomyces sp. NPDC088560]|uniref:sigma factor n=1 Tax=Streptomyces sp. NPDC088560 TaxID=3365868 RepID=UPI0037F5837A